MLPYPLLSPFSTPPPLAVAVQYCPLSLIILITNSLSCPHHHHLLLLMVRGPSSSAPSFLLLRLERPPLHHLHLFSSDKESLAIIYIDTISSFLCARHHHHHVFFLAVCSVSARLQLLLLLPSSSSRIAIYFGLCLLFLSMQLHFSLLLTVSLFHLWTVAVVLVIATVQLRSLLSPLLCVYQLVRTRTGRQEQLFLLPHPSSPANSFSSPCRELCFR